MQQSNLQFNLVSQHFDPSIMCTKIYNSRQFSLALKLNYLSPIRDTSNTLVRFYLNGTCKNYTFATIKYALFLITIHSSFVKYNNLEKLLFEKH